MRDETSEFSKIRMLLHELDYSAFEPVNLRLGRDIDFIIVNDETFRELRVYLAYESELYEIIP